MKLNEYPTHPSFALRLVRKALLALVFMMVSLAGILAWPALQARLQTRAAAPSHSLAALSSPLSISTTPAVTAFSRTPTKTFSPSPSPTATITPEAPTETMGAAQSTPIAPNTLPEAAFDQGLIFLSLSDDGYSHLYAYQPQSLPYTRLTNGGWNDITPALSPDGNQLAFSSNRDGQYDLYLMNLSTGQVTRLTDTPAYDANPTFSPDGRWIAYESLVEDGGGLEIFIRPLDFSQDPIRLTDNPAADYAPAWSPLGRQVAFVSTRSGEEEIWLADLDKIDDRFEDLSRNAETADTHPSWSPDGTRLAWASAVQDGIQNLMVWDGSPGMPYMAGSGSWPAWSPDGASLITALRMPNQTYLTGYDSRKPGVVLPPMALSGPLDGLTWGKAHLPETFPDSWQSAAQVTATPLWLPALTPQAGIPGGRQRVVPLEGVEAPNPMLQDLVDESFQALRKRVAEEAGWDFLSNLENAFVPVTNPLDPGQQADWLYTGRAFAFNTLPMNAGWLVVSREDFGAQTYWRVYVKARFQDGSQGEPLRAQPWDFRARYSGTPRDYEEGGALAGAIPEGYWVDVTRLALAYGWQRLPALSTWRSAFSAARFNEFVLTDGLDWYSAMMEIYPAEALVTPTPVLPAP